jgi:hypothetical protein
MEFWIELFEQASRDSRSWKRLIAALVTVLFVILTSVGRSRSQTAKQETRTRSRHRRPYAPVEPRGFPIAIWWGFLVVTAAAYVALLPYVTSLPARILMAGACIVWLVLLRVLAGRPGGGRAPLPHDSPSGERSKSVEKGNRWTSTTRGST